MSAFNRYRQRLVPGGVAAIAGLAMGSAAVLGAAPASAMPATTSLPRLAAVEAQAADGTVATRAVNPACVGPFGLLGPFGPLGPAGPLGPTGIILVNPAAYPLVFQQIWFGSPAMAGLAQICFGLP